MNKNKHLVRSDRDTIKSMLDENCNFTQIAEAIGKARTTISREVRNRSVYVRKNVKYAIYNACKHRFSCEKKHVCSTCERSGRIRQVKFCRKCNLCNFRCNDFLPDPCPKLNRSPFVCNGCGYSSGCSLEKKYYYADQADDKYRTLLSESRSGISYSEEELMELSDLVTPLIKKNQSPHHICITNADVLNVSERTLYRLINAMLRCLYNSRMFKVFPQFGHLLIISFLTLAISNAGNFSSKPQPGWITYPLRPTTSAQ